MSETFQGSQDYVASEELMRAVNIAMVLQKPLLIKGEPGTGKTVLAEAIAKSLGKELIIWNIKSTTKAQDGLYVYDVVQRLYDSQFGGEGVDDIEKYVKLGKLGEAFTADDQVILLIDEIDKADLEFPNDLLWELDRMEFHIPETGRTVTAKHRPIVIITSNAEKELPDAFLRRCVFHYIEFPDRELMAEIVNVHFQDLDQHLLDQVLERFGNYTYIQCELETGRTHQIRVHMASLGHPLLGDMVYGPKKCPFPHLQGQTLHARTLGIIHPRTGEYLEVNAPLPAYFIELLDKLRKS